MRVTFLKSASVIIEHDGAKVACDPWLVDGEFYGSWAHYPPYKFNPRDFDDLDYIYVSHIHMDHCSRKTLIHLNKDIPVLIHNFHSKFLKGNIERMGFKVIELDHNKHNHLKNGLYANVFAADSCDPDICKKYWGCAYYAEDMQEGKPVGSTQIDTMCVFDNGKEVIINANDCPFPLSQQTIKTINQNYSHVDMLLLGYSSASPYPQCYDLSIEEKSKIKNDIVKQYYTWAEGYVNAFRPRYFLPFAGQYTLAGKLHVLNNQKAVPTIDETYDYLSSTPNIDHTKHQCVALSSGSYFDLSTGNASEPYRKIDQKEYNEYLENVLSKTKYDYEDEPEPALEEILSLIPKSFERFESMRSKLGYTSDWKILIELSEDNFVAISCDGGGVSMVSKQDISSFNKYIIISVDKRLLKRVLKGPAHAHWNNVDLGCFLRITRVPNVYDRGLYYCLNFLHS